MSFDVNVLSVKPVIREAANMNNDGGGGNLGYMQQSKDESKDKRQKFDESIFGKKQEDVFVCSNDLKGFEEGFSFLKLVENIISGIKKIFVK